MRLSFSVVDLEWMVHMVFRERANSIRRQELSLIKNVAINPLQLWAIRNREQQTRTSLSLLAHVDVIVDVRMMVEEPLHAAAEPRHALQVFRLVGFDSEQRDQSYH